METNTGKGLISGIYTVWYTVMVVAAVIYGLAVLQDTIAIISAGDTAVLGGANGWKVLMVLFLETAAFLLTVLTVKNIYSRRKQGYKLALASAAAGAAHLVPIILFMGHTPIFSIVFYSVVSVAILFTTQRAKDCLTSSEEQNQNDFL